MTGSRSRDIAAWNVELDGAWFPAMLETALSDRAWAHRAVDAVREVDPGAGEPGDVLDQLAALRATLMTRGSPLLQAAVMIRPESIYTIGCVATSDLIALDDDDDVDGFESLLRGALERPAPGVRTLDAAYWRERVPAGDVVATYQRYDVATPGEPLSVGYQRTLYGIFPDDCLQMIQLDFTSSDLAAFADMRAETSAMLTGITVETEAAAR